MRDDQATIRRYRELDLVSSSTVRGSGKSQMLLGFLFKTAQGYQKLPEDRKIDYVCLMLKIKANVDMPEILTQCIDTLYSMLNEDEFSYIGFFDLVVNFLPNMALSSFEHLKLPEAEMEILTTLYKEQGRENLRIAEKLDYSASLIKDIAEPTFDCVEVEEVPSRAERRAYRENARYQHGSKVAARFQAKQNFQNKQHSGRRSSRGR